MRYINRRFTYLLVQFEECLTRLQRCYVYTSSVRCSLRRSAYSESDLCWTDQSARCLGHEATRRLQSVEYHLPSCSEHIMMHHRKQASLYLAHGPQDKNVHEVSQSRQKSATDVACACINKVFQVLRSQPVQPTYRTRLKRSDRSIQ